MNFPNKNILCIGEVLWDVLADTRKPGGAPLNVALHLARQGNRVNMVSGVGNDQNGRELIGFIKNAGLETKYIQVDKSYPTSEVIVQLDARGNAGFEIKEPVAWDKLDYNPDLKVLSANAGIIIYGSLASRNKHTRETVIKALCCDALKFIDVNLRPPFTNISLIKELLCLADFAKLNDDELRTIAGWDDYRSDNERELTEWISRRYKLSMVCVTRGENGAILYTPGNYSEHPGFKVEVADTVGAGDAFLAGLVSSLLKDMSPLESLEYACATGALVASRRGASPAYKPEEIKSIITNSI